MNSPFTCDNKFVKFRASPTTRGGNAYRKIHIALRFPRVWIIPNYLQYKKTQLIIYQLDIKKNILLHPGEGGKYGQVDQALHLAWG